MKENVIEVKRVSGRCMCIKIKTGKGIVNVASLYAPQVGCTEEEKDTLSEELEDSARAFGVREYVIIGAGLNGHIGGERTGSETNRGGNAFGNLNSEEVRILVSVEAMDMMTGNSWYKKREGHLLTYASWGALSQIDDLLTRREHKHVVKDCKVLPGEAVVSQYKLVVTELRIVKKRKSKLRGSDR